MPYGALLLKIEKYRYRQNIARGYRRLGGDGGGVRHVTLVSEGSSGRWRVNQPGVGMGRVYDSTAESSPGIA
jgi:hypothetical protein